MDWYLLKGHTYLNVQLKAVGLCEYMWPFDGHKKDIPHFCYTFLWEILQENLSQQAVKYS